MTKIPSVEEVIKSLPKHYSNVRCSEDNPMVPLSAVRQALLIAEKRGLEEARKQVKCRYDIDGTACDCCQGNHDRIDDLI